MSHVLRDQILAVLDATQSMLQKIFDGIPADKFLHQPFPGANHAMWTMGHLATVDQFFLKTLAGRDPALFEQYRERFFAKSQPNPDASSYPPLESVREYFKKSRADFRTWIETLDDEKLNAPLTGELERFSPTIGILLGRLAWHEGMHYGQLTVIRKSLGLTPVRI